MKTILDTPLLLSFHSQKRLKKRVKIKNSPEMQRRVQQAYHKGCFIERDTQGNEYFLFNNYVYIFNNNVLLTVYQVDLHNGLMKIFMQKHKKIIRRKFYETC